MIGHRRTVELRLLDQFLEVRKQIVQAVSDLTDVDVRVSIPEERRSELARVMSKLFYQHYDFLPPQVLEAIMLLQVALTHPKRAPYAIKDGVIVPMTAGEISPFVESCSMYANARLFTPMALFE